MKNWIFYNSRKKKGEKKRLWCLKFLSCFLPLLTAFVLNLGYNDGPLNHLLHRSAEVNNLASMTLWKGG